MGFSKIGLFFFLCFVLQITKAQQLDSITVDRQVFQVTPELTYSYKAPKIHTGDPVIKEKKTSFNTRYNFNRILSTNVVGATITF